ncbi:MAG: type IV pilus assembly protein PilM [Candidatus Andersenbacteria bacterium]|nr:type IV pilus assembly protein PilM [Candidatus Andersenbacteria bacterium]MBI3250960.1 type IV pilus assembly protein PilM [Candidatus Andersenbacteria bacterium]
MVGIDISDRSIKVAEVSEGQSQHIVSVCWSSLPPGALQRGIVQNAPLIIEAITQAFQKCSPVPVKKRSVIASIPEVRSFVRVLELPAMAEEELDEAIKWAVRQHIPFDLERMYIDWEPVGEPDLSGRRQVLVGAAQRDVVNPLLEVLEAAGLRVTALELEAQAIVRSLLPLDRRGVQGVLIVDLGATTTNIIYVNAGSLRFSTSIEVGGDTLTWQLAGSLHLQPAVADEKKAEIGLRQQQDQDVATALRIATLELARKVEKVVREVGTQEGSQQAVREILLAGGAANLPGIIEIFAEIFPGIPIQMGNPWTNLVREEEKSFQMSPQDASHFATALGLALRQDVST